MCPESVTPAPSDNPPGPSGDPPKPKRKHVRTGAPVGRPRKDGLPSGVGALQVLVDPTLPDRLLSLERRQADMEKAARDMATRAVKEADRAPLPFRAYVRKALLAILSAPEEPCQKRPPKPPEPTPAA